MTTDQDTEHLNLLAIFHYVVAGIVTLISLFPMIHIAIGIAIVSGAFDGQNPNQAPPAIFGWFFIVIPAMIMLIGLALAVAIALAGRWLSARRRHTFCVVVAGIECAFMPFGTVLGVLTLIVLLRPSVKLMFDQDE
ncbi:hypothetical protein K227x_02680 [Rubripirellula lacrimiformis]|uniref:Uncharacterized protein n=1 Tax=Rubripirellula lacrimiformis TaxID=1930273 RepID=A0A517N431_9BACT|nr:hypothetical protein [Rubripirellula lacrimiformis]QDT01899.1 hypothetical protein K227x_02680 [Rubripirellula lacrimiformis]